MRGWHIQKWWGIGRLYIMSYRIDSTGRELDIWSMYYGKCLRRRFLREWSLLHFVRHWLHFSCREHLIGQLLRVLRAWVLCGCRLMHVLRCRLHCPCRQQLQLELLLNIRVYFCEWSVGTMRVQHLRKRRHLHVLRRRHVFSRRQYFHGKLLLRGRVLCGCRLMHFLRCKYDISRRQYFSQQLLPVLRVGFL